MNSRLLVLALTFMTVSAASGQDQPNPLGQPLVGPEGMPIEGAFHDLPLRPGDEIYSDLEGARLKALLMEVDRISLEDRDRGNLFWGRNVGTWGHDRTQEWVESHFRRLGLTDIHREPFELDPQWQVQSWEIAFTGPEGSFELPSARPAVGTRSTPTEASTTLWSGSDRVRRLTFSVETCAVGPY